MQQDRANGTPFIETYGSLFSGGGGLDMAIEAVFGARPAWQAEFEEAPSRVLAAHFPGVPNLGDVTKVDWRTTANVDLICGGSPCQDISSAGRRAGMTVGTRSNLWVVMREAISIIKPKLVVWENVRGAASANASCDLGWTEGLLDERPETEKPAKEKDHPLRALGRVLGDLSDAGYDAAWRGIRASDLGACHHRFRFFVVAWRRDLADTEGSGWHHGLAPYLGPRGGSATETVSMLPTPGAYDGDRGGSQHPDKRRAGGHSVALQDVAEHTVDWGRYEPAIRSHELLVGRPAPEPTQLSKTGKPQLSPRFVEWMMGWPDGWVTDVPLLGLEEVEISSKGVDQWLSRSAQLKVLGNGVFPHQAIAAIQANLHSIISALEPGATREVA